MGDTATYNLCIDQGATFIREFVWNVGSCCCSSNGTPIGASPTPVDLTGYTAEMQFRAFVLSPTVLYNATSNLVLGGTAGTITLTIPNTSTSTFTWNNAVYDLLLTSSAGVATRLLSGNVTVSPSVSQ